jgi:hypothetical protein
MAETLPQVTGRILPMPETLPQTAGSNYRVKNRSRKLREAIIA